MGAREEGRMLIWWHFRARTSNPLPSSSLTLSPQVIHCVSGMCSPQKSIPRSCAANTTMRSGSSSVAPASVVRFRTTPKILLLCQVPPFPSPSIRSTRVWSEVVGRLPIVQMLTRTGRTITFTLSIMSSVPHLPSMASRRCSLRSQKYNAARPTTLSWPLAMEQMVAYSQACSWRRVVSPAQARWSHH